MCDKNALNLLENKVSECRNILYDVQTFIKLGALASDSGITDEDLQLHKSSDDYYILLYPKKAWSTFFVSATNSL